MSIIYKYFTFNYVGYNICLFSFDSISLFQPSVAYLAAAAVLVATFAASDAVDLDVEAVAAVA